MQLKIDKLVYGGDGLARLPADDQGPGKSVFVPFVLEGETVEAKIIEDKRSFARAELVSLLEAAPHRIQAGCPYYQRCGGCHYQHTDYKHQLAIKADVLKETLRRTAKLELPCKLQIHVSPEWGYRNRTRLKVQTAPEFALGYYRFRSHELLPIEQCPVSSPLINQAITSLWQAGRDGKIGGCAREIELFANAEDTAILAEVYCAPGTSRSDARKLSDNFAGFLLNASGMTIFEQAAFNSTVEPKHLAAIGAESLDYKTAQSSYRVSAGAFFQGYRFLVDRLLSLVTDGAAGQLALDLYAGVGLFSAVLARSFAQVIAVEASQTSYSDLSHNCGREVKAVRSTTEKYLDQSPGLHPDLVVADPPRGGLGENVVRKLAGMDSPRVCYVSCDPSTLARDLRTFVSLGYRINDAHLIDLFPQTFHIESVFHLAR
ncbi:MAG TPA: 23S rRNA (uracil(1939)-C(5))-methyltransferase RlmD [Terriglobales bacterium]